MVTEAPTAPLDGLMEDIDGVGNITKGAALIPVTPFTVTAMGPVVAPIGTVVVILVVVDAVTRVGVPLNVTVLLLGVGLKFVPVMITVAPVAQLVGLKLVIVGDGIVKFVALAPVIPFTVTEIGPVLAPKGTVVVMLVPDDAVTTASVPLKRTVFSPGIELKLVPVIVTVVPKVPLVGLKLVIEGVPWTVKFDELTKRIPFTVMKMGPVPAPIGTLTVILVEFDETIVAVMPLKSTAETLMKFVPLIITA